MIESCRFPEEGNSKSVEQQSGLQNGGCRRLSRQTAVIEEHAGGEIGCNELVIKKDEMAGFYSWLLISRRNYCKTEYPKAYWKPVKIIIKCSCAIGGIELMHG